MLAARVGLRNYCRTPATHSVRSVRNPASVAITLLILALGIGATTVMFAVIIASCCGPLLTLSRTGSSRCMGPFKNSANFGASLIRTSGKIEHTTRTMRVAGLTYSGGTISAPGEPEHVEARLISADLFSVLELAPAYGRGFQSDEDRPGAAPVAIISYGLWQRRFHSIPTGAALGQKLVFDGRAYEVVGVAPPGFQLSGAADVYTPIGQSTDPRLQNRGARFLRVLGV